MTFSINSLKYNDQGLIPAVVQDHLTGEVRMMAWMNREALEQTLKTRKATFFSRSRQSSWVKGETSGHFLEVHQVFADCDADTILVLAEPRGPSCHTGAENCFLHELIPDLQEGENLDDVRVKENSLALPFFSVLERELEGRRASTGEKSYTRSLFDGGAKKIGEKVCEEAGELAEALANESDERVANEAADEIYHLLVGVLWRKLSFRSVLRVLAGRFGVGGHDEKASRLSK
ncbi:MAG: bifunctional phosphoribosyl-AMP cyclohydrolase/phosphoribosyl-ATP diphosphatase HisIE [Polyangiaceae bacterium]|nr:bifunctional phosphoribosyl-AMP cyclohydrolase/phosphoribosyl-ATP diphosphatase HisIE [Polyangiaceae bacterium]